ncbi:flotillin family protein [Xanthovirga aplysinae]|uniref:flotillin family protein n=1 Tax=Xanthovirga aplysinae TaxID=2529853 RepID=UPI0012BD6B21|nr:flotillin family protein [Xanthovirga aplysinae]MTI32290.1 flotillin family protein [Xanthovirga aplysinae]
MDILEQTIGAAIIIGVVVLIGIIALFIKMYKKAVQGEALVKTGLGGTKVDFSGMFVVPVLHKLEKMDITLKTIVISRTGSEGLICKDNLRADIKVTFFVRVNKTEEDVKDVAQSIGCSRASDPQQLEQLFDAKFSEALKTVGKRFDFVELYNSRNDFKLGILDIIGTDLNGYVLDDCAIDYLEQTPVASLDANNILDAQGIKKITELTSKEKVEANLIENEKEKTIKQQNVEAKETLLQLDKQLAENEEKQRREIATIKSREQAEIDKVAQEERLKAEQARIATEEEIQVAEQNKARQVLVAEKNKEKTDAIESERVDKERLLEQTEKDRIVALAQIEKEKALEEERKNIQDVIRERVAVEKAVVEEEEKIKETKAIAEADRNKKVAITNAEKEAEETLVKEIKLAEAKRQAAEFKAKQLLVESEAEQASAGQRAEAIKILAEAEAAKEAALGMSEAQVMEAKAAALEKEGDAQAHVIEAKGEAEAAALKNMGVAQAEADKKIGLANAEVMEATATAEEKKGLAGTRVEAEKYTVEAKGIADKAEAMKQLDNVSREHEEFRLRLDTQKEIEMAKLEVEQRLAEAQAGIMAEALKAAKIDIVGGESMFFDQITKAITKGKAIDRAVDNSKTLGQLKDNFFNGNGNGEVSSFKENLRAFVDQFGVSSDELKSLSISALLLKMSQQTSNQQVQQTISEMENMAKTMGVSDKTLKAIGLA